MTHNKQWQLHIAVGKESLCHVCVQFLCCSHACEIYEFSMNITTMIKWNQKIFL